MLFKNMLTLPYAIFLFSLFVNFPLRDVIGRSKYLYTKVDKITVKIIYMKNATYHGMIWMLKYLNNIGIIIDKWIKYIE